MGALTIAKVARGVYNDYPPTPWQLPFIVEGRMNHEHVRGRSRACKKNAIGSQGAALVAPSACPNKHPARDPHYEALITVFLSVAYRFMPTRSSVRKVSLTRSVVGTTIDANDCPIDGVKDGTCDGVGIGCVVGVSGHYPCMLWRLSWF